MCDEHVSSYVLLASMLCSDDTVCTAVQSVLDDGIKKCLEAQRGGTVLDVVGRATRDNIVKIFIESSINASIRQHGTSVPSSAPHSTHRLSETHVFGLLLVLHSHFEDKPLKLEVEVGSPQNGIGVLKSLKPRSPFEGKPILNRFKRGSCSRVFF